ncbi:conserved hypothetical protein [Leishmania braziliensis MHOM/BR/75/M2904]|uniref:Uncharacterized protein n=2 Tax=Leishmania braziliensis TaxID=5660 RepID=A4HD01_LEIBR|nr:conserved hypothetical protein [Leishmania braziliensis MHOM/BR/75/M2904]CAJ2473324.1 unnamed protein product [Leishmania braziliensis]CAM36647.1 conserved hypothetical protein [Leishmania braziliensis MHOM/BR/75/M2904]SYZ66123.1 hypothetical_protein [Leishmania braziliensis MHOM/BR/75/M2904]
MPLVVQQQYQHRTKPDSEEEGRITNAAAPAPVSAPQRDALASIGTTPADGAQTRRSSSSDYSHLLTLAQPQLTASEKTLFALFRSAQKERQLVRLQRSTVRPERFIMEGSGAGIGVAHDRRPSPFTDPLLHLRDLEEPCLLIPDTRDTFVSLGLTVGLHPTTDTPASPTSACASLAGGSAAARTPPALSPSSPASDVGLAAHAAATADSTIMDAFHIGLACTSTHYRSDYTSLPEHYVLGVPTALLSLLRSNSSISKHEVQKRKCSADAWRSRSQTPVDLSRWLAFDMATSQVLLRRRGVPSTNDPLVPTWVAALESQVFLAHTYSFDPKSAYQAAALQAGVPVPPSARSAESSTSASEASMPMMKMTSPPLYSLFFFTVARGQATANSRISPIHAGVLYPSCFFSYMSEVPTTQHLAAEMATVAAQFPRLNHAGDSKPSMLMSSAMGAGPVDNASFFVPISGKRLRLGASASSSTPAHLWTAQLQSRKLGAIAVSAPAPSSSPYVKQAELMTTGCRPQADSSALRSQGGRDSWRQSVVCQKMSESFRIWREAVASRASSLPLRTSTSATASAEDSAPSRAPPPMADGQQRLPAPLPRPEHPRQINKLMGSVPWPPASCEHGREAGHRSRLEEQLDAEGVALISDDGTLSQEWSAGFRFGRVAIAVAMPLLFPISTVVTDAAAASNPLPAAQQGLQTSGANAAINAAVRVIDAPLADALWSVLYAPVAATSPSPATLSGPFTPHSSFFSSTVTGTANAAAETVMASVLPMAEDRLMLARERVLLPFLLHQPRWVLPWSDLHGELPSSSPPVSDTGKGLRSACKSNGPSPVNVCPSLWRLDELEQICGWRRHRLPFNDAFGSFSGLLIHDLYIMIGRKTSAMLPGPIPATTLRVGQAGKQQATLSPVVLLNDVVYVERVLLPAMRCFAANTCTWVEGGLCVYRSPYEALSTEMCYEAEGDFTISKKPNTSSLPRVAPQQWDSKTSCNDEPAELPAETAVEVALHHWQLSLWLKQLQRTSHKLLRRWLAECHGRTSLDPALEARVRRRTGGVPAACLAFFVGSCSTAPSMLSSRASPAPYDGGSGGGDDHDDLGDFTAVAASAEAIEKGLQRLLSLTPDRIAVVPLLDFVVWGALCSDFAAASMQRLAHAADGCRAALDASADGLTAVKYCVRYPRHLCCHGGRGATVALLC